MFEGLEVPEVLRNGNHALINRWRRKEALKATWLHRPELLGPLAKADAKLLAEVKAEAAAATATAAHAAGENAAVTTAVSTDGKNVAATPTKSGTKPELK